MRLACVRIPSACNTRARAIATCGFCMRAGSSAEPRLRLTSSASTDGGKGKKKALQTQRPGLAAIAAVSTDTPCRKAVVSIGICEL